MNPNVLANYFIMGTINCPPHILPLDILKEALEGGITLFQLREKGDGALQGHDYLTFARQCKDLCRQYNVPFIINDDVELAVFLDADGVHVGQDDLDVQTIRERFPNKWIGLSVHTIAELDEAIEQKVDYVGIGPIYATSSKADAKAPCGVEFIERARQHAPNMPIVAIGGIQLENVDDISAAGANGVAIISAIAQATSPKKAAHDFHLATLQLK